MKNILFLLLIAAVAACSPLNPDRGIDEEDESTVDDEDTEKLTPPAYDVSVNWATCGSHVDEHPCNIKGTDQNGEPFDLYTHYNSLIVLDFSTMWCGPCNQAAVDVQHIQDVYVNFNLIYVTILIENMQGETPTQSDVEQWASTYGITTAPVIAGERSMLASSGGSWDITGWPTFYYIDHQMLIRDVDRGYNGQEVIYSIEWLLGQ